MLKDQVHTKEEIPNAKFYVVMVDDFMSGWGPAKGVKNRLIFLCETKEEMHTVRKNALKRDEMRGVIWFTEKPNINRRDLHQVKTRETMPTWYKANAWD